MNTIELNHPTIIRTEATAQTSFRQKEINASPQLNALRLFFSVGGKYVPTMTAKIATNLFLTPRKSKKKKPLPEIFESASTYYLPYDRGNLKVYSWGFYGPRILLVHGWESRASTFRNVVPKLLEEGYRVVAFDGPAHGDSSGKQTNLVNFSKAIRSVIDYFEYSGGVSYIMGHSFGAGAVSLMLSDLKEKMPVKKLILISMPALVDKVIADFCEYMSISGTVESKIFDHILRITGRELKDFNLPNRFKDISAEDILIVHDKQDEVVPVSHTYALMKDANRPKYLFTENFGHYDIIKDELIIDKVIEFLKTN
ncbi:alpha/beta hydrolase [Fulvivirgaceae bacterium BMA10]|uniref:Alpha/beta hydrolase n=1 Tax=Splendidivirga corallicola TaxID=3051826 RepID=A0ABT8KSM5_9BACT|nr:alpha/beta hydrolase [Fulvivirgaceae bacterium BMA10]